MSNTNISSQRSEVCYKSYIVTAWRVDGIQLVPYQGVIKAPVIKSYQDKERVYGVAYKHIEEIARKLRKTIVKHDQITVWEEHRFGQRQLGL